MALDARQQILRAAYQDRVEAYTDLYYSQAAVVPYQDEAAMRQIGKLVDNLQNVHARHGGSAGGTF